MDVNTDVAGILTSLLIISSASLIIPTALDATEPTHAEVHSFTAASPYILASSRTTSIILLIFYLIYLYFQTISHANLFECEEEEVEGAVKIGSVASSIVLVLATVGVAVCSDYLVDSVDGLVEALGISRSFIGLIIVPIVGNAAEFVATVQWARTNRIKLAMSVIVGSTLQISLFVTPFLVILGWMMDVPMSLQFHQFETIVLTMSVLVVNCICRDGQTNYFEGFLLFET